MILHSLPFRGLEVGTALIKLLGHCFTYVIGLGFLTSNTVLPLPAAFVLVHIQGLIAAWQLAAPHNNMDR